MIAPPGYYYVDHSEFYRKLREHFKSRGRPERRFFELEQRWIAQKGYRPPQVAPAAAQR